jgi:hypothetical protein
MDQILPVRVRPRTAVTARTLLGGVRSQGRPVRAASKWPSRDTLGGPTIRPCMYARVLTRLKRSGWFSTPVRGEDEYPRATCRVLGGVTWRKWRENLTDEVPRRSLVVRLRISTVIRPMPKGGVRRRRVRSIPWLSLLGDSSVSGGGLLWFFFSRPKGHTDDRGVDESPGTGPVSPRVATASGPPAPFLGRPRVCEEQTQCPADSTSSVGLLTEDHVYAYGFSTHTPGALAHG